jgi:hypothetical protein
MAITKADHLPRIISTVLVALRGNTSRLLLIPWSNRHMVLIPTKGLQVRAGLRALHLLAFKVARHHSNLLMVNHLTDKAINTRLDPPDQGMATRVFSFWESMMRLISWESWTVGANAIDS